MALSVIVSGEIEIARRKARQRALLFARGGQPIADDVTSDPAPSVLVVRRGGGDHRRGEILGYLSTMRRTLDGVAGRGDVFLIDGLRLHGDLAGFSPGAHRLLIALAVVRLAWTEADHEGVPALVAIRVRMVDQRVREDLRMLRAQRLSTREVVRHDLFSMSDHLPSSQPVEYWQVTPEMAQQCARLVERDPGSDDPWRIDRVSGVRQQLRLTLDMPWLRIGGGLLDTLAERAGDLSWGPLPGNDVEGQADRAAERELPDGDKPPG